MTTPVRCAGVLLVGVGVSNVTTPMRWAGVLLVGVGVSNVTTPVPGTVFGLRLGTPGKLFGPRLTMAGVTCRLEAGTDLVVSVRLSLLASGTALRGLLDTLFDPDG